MSKQAPSIRREEAAIELYQPRPGTAYTIEATARLTDLPRHAILVYYKHGIISPVAAPHETGYYFDDRAIRTLRRIGPLKAMRGINVSSIKMILDLMEEIEQLRSAIRVLRR
jgi:DNA-binding transcriptional MerR regulator